MIKIEVSVSIDRDVLERVDRLAGGTSRSEIVERALRQWPREQRRVELEDRVAAYYSGRDNQDIDADREWAELSADQFERT